RGGAVAPFIVHFTEVFFPKFFAVEVVAKDAGRAVPDHHARAVGDGSRPAIGIRLMRWFNDGELNSLHPKLFARPPVEAVQVSLPARVFRTSDKDATMRNDGAAVTRTWECRFPSDVIRRSPMERRFVLLSDTIPERAAELRPIPSAHCQGQQQGKRSSSLKKYSAIHVQGEARI
ncbi:MAG: hypothetical protein JWM04_104, partial [Verrucomicrobiales bacterium]|nr:hypothetical protein [Verrucomicrobiales bacterium]